MNNNGPADQVSHRFPALLFLLTIYFHISFSQIIPNPLFPYEKLQWRSSFSEVKSLFPSISPLPAGDKNSNAFSKLSDDHFLYAADSIYHRSGKVALMFSKKDSLLFMMQVMIMGKKGSEEEITAKECESFWELTANRFGEPAQDKKIPFMGKVRTWNIGTTSIMIMKMESPSTMVLLSYTKKE